VQGIRTLRRSPAFATVAVLTIALGVGMATAVYSVGQAIAWSSLPVHEPDRVVVLYGEHRRRNLTHLPLRPRQLEAFTAATHTLNVVAAMDYNGAWDWTFREGERPLRVSASTVTGNFFQVLGTTPALGRLLRPEDDVVGAPSVIVISHALWLRQFGGDSSVIGRSLMSHERGHAYEIVGVAPRGLDFPRGVELWSPIIPFTTATGTDTSYAHVDLIGRLGDRATPAQAEADFTTFLQRPETFDNALLSGANGVVRPLDEVVVGDVRPTMRLVSVAVGLVLLIAALNVATLLLIRGVGRRPELALRAALGANRGRLMRQLMVEALVLAGIGGLLGVASAWAAVQLLAAALPPALPRLAPLEVDGSALALAALATLAASCVFGLLPALGAVRRDLHMTIQGHTRSVTGGLRARLARYGLLITQLALGLVVLASAGLVTRAFIRLQRTDLGMETDRVFLLQLLPAWMSWGDESPLARYRAMLDEMLARVESVPGVESAAPVILTPYSGTAGWDGLVTVEGAVGDPGATPYLNMEITSARYAATMGIERVRGRFLEDTDREEAPLVVVLSEEAARRVLPTGDPIGKRVRFASDAAGAWRTVVGIVVETRYRELAASRPTIYIPYRQFDAPPTFIAVRTRADPSRLTEIARAAAAGVSASTLVESKGTFATMLSHPMARPRAAALVLGAFAAAALALAAVGVYGVMSAFVAQRRQEIGVRIALGAAPHQVQLLVLREGMGAALVGTALGLAITLPSGSVVRALVEGSERVGMVGLLPTVGVLLIVAMAACLVPAWRASRLDPLSTMRG